MNSAGESLRVGRIPWKREIVGVVLDYLGGLACQPYYPGAQAWQPRRRVLPAAGKGRRCRVLHGHETERYLFRFGQSLGKFWIVAREAPNMLPVGTVVMVRRGRVAPWCEKIEKRMWVLAVRIDIVFEIRSPSEVPLTCRMYSPLFSRSPAQLLAVATASPTALVSAVPPVFTALSPISRRLPDIVTDSPGSKSGTVCT